MILLVYIQSLVSLIADTDLKIILRIGVFEEGLIVGALFLALVLLLLMIYYLVSEKKSTKKLRSEADARKIELIEKYEIQKALFQGSVDPIIIFNSNNQIVDYNKAAEKFFGFNFFKLLGKEFSGNELFNNKFAEWMKIFKKAEGISGYNTFVRVNSGVSIPASISISPIFNINGELTNLFFWYRDISKDYEFQNTLKQSEESYKGLFENVNDAILVLRKSDRKIMDTNKHALELYGFKYTELVDSTMGKFSDSIFDDYRQLDDIIKGKIKFGEAIHKKKDGSKIFIEFNASILNYKNEDVIIIVARDITARRNYAVQLQKSLKEKEVLLREVHHRVKNNLQLITSLLDLQISTTKDESAIKIFLESQNRIRVMSIVYERIYESDDLHTIDTQKFVQNIINYLYEVYNGGEKNIHIDYLIDKFSLDIETAVPVALILCELVTNALKYAFPESSYSNTIEITFTRSAANKAAMHPYRLSIKDNGGTFPDGLNPEDSTSLGLQLVYILSKQLKGKVDYNFTGGTEFRIEYAGE